MDHVKKFTLKKLPAFGYPMDPDAIDFQWPTEELIQKMKQDVTVDTIILKSDPESKLLSSVQFVLSDGKKSEEIQADSSIEHVDAQTFKIKESVRTIRASDACPGVYNLNLASWRDPELLRYNPG